MVGQFWNLQISVCSMPTHHCYWQWENIGALDVCIYSFSIAVAHSVSKRRCPGFEYWFCSFYYVDHLEQVTSPFWMPLFLCRSGDSNTSNRMRLGALSKDVCTTFNLASDRISAQSMLAGIGGHISLCSLCIQGTRLVSVRNKPVAHEWNESPVTGLPGAGLLLLGKWRLGGSRVLFFSLDLWVLLNNFHETLLIININAGKIWLSLLGSCWES